MRLQAKHLVGNFILFLFYNILVFSSDTLSLCAQEPVFFLMQEDLLDNTSEKKSLALVCADINGDYRDDIVSCNRNDQLLFHLQMNAGEVFKTVLHTPYVGFKEPTTINIGNFDNLAHNEILTSAFYNGLSVHQSNSKLWESTNSTLENISVFAQGSSLFDINNDGWLDAIITHDDAKNYALINNQSGHLNPSNIIDFETAVPSDNSGNYSAIWFDANNDTVQDLYISKCRVGANSPDDPRRINTLYINENGTFREAATEFNLDLGEQSWAADSGDLDNDGDIDLVILNHEDPHCIMKNNGDGSFSKVIDFSTQGIIETPDLQIAVADFNNDTWQDILIAGQEDYLLLNKGNFDFDIMYSPFGFKTANSFALGDLNDDGYMDAVAFVLGFKDEVWMNLGGSNNYSKFSLNGIQSNKSGIGSKLELYGSWGKQTQWLNSGTSYGITNSLNIHFGLADATTIDSVKCIWPSGQVDTYHDLNINAHYVLTEGMCLEPILKIEVEEPGVICNDSALEIRIDKPSSSDYVWNTNAIDSLITIDTTGLYFARSMDSICVNFSQILDVPQISMIEDVKLSFKDELVLCEDWRVPLSTNIPNDLVWSTGEIDTTIEIINAGAYYASEYPVCDLYSDTLEVFNWASILKDTIFKFTSTQASVNLEAESESVTWYSDPFGMDEIGHGSDFIVNNVVEDTLVYAQEHYDYEWPTFMGGPSISSSTIEISDSTENISTTFDVRYPVELKSISVTAEKEGLRDIIIFNNDQGFVFQQEYFIPEGDFEIEINMILAEGEYTLLPGLATNLSSFGHASPAFNFTMNGSNNKKDLYGYLELNKDNSPSSFFFDWTFTPIYETCYSKLFEYKIVIDTTSSTLELSYGQFEIYPIPANDILHIQSDLQIDKIWVIDAIGIESLEFISPTSTLNIRQLRSGSYVLKVQVDGKFIYKKFIKL